MPYLVTLSSRRLVVASSCSRSLSLQQKTRKQTWVRRTFPFTAVRLKQESAQQEISSQSCRQIQMTRLCASICTLYYQDSLFWHLPGGKLPHEPGRGDLAGWGPRVSTVWAWGVAVYCSGAQNQTLTWTSWTWGQFVGERGKRPHPQLCKLSHEIR